MVAVAIGKGLFVCSILFNFSDALLCFLHHSYRVSQSVFLPPASIRKLSGAGAWGRRLHMREDTRKSFFEPQGNFDLQITKMGSYLLLQARVFKNGKIKLH